MTHAVLTRAAREALQAKAREAAYAMPLEDIDLSDGALHAQDTVWPYYERLRREAPVHFRREAGAVAGRAFWSVTRYQDIMSVDINHKVFSSEAEHGGIVVMNVPARVRNRSFIAMDPPDHDAQRRAVSPVVAPDNLKRLSGLIRERVCRILDDLPRNETFDWVERVSKELTAQMLATLFGFPFDDRHLLPYWTEVITAVPPIDDEPAWQARDVELARMFDYFTGLWNERVNAEPSNDLISMLAHSPATREMTPSNFRGNVVLLTVGGNDTTRNSISGGLWVVVPESEPRSIREARRQPRSGHEHGARDHPLPDPAVAHGANGPRGHRTGGTDDTRGRARGHVVRLGQPG